MQTIGDYYGGSEMNKGLAHLRGNCNVGLRWEGEHERKNDHDRWYQ